ncbi:MAG: class I SAM-dependent methyltransferase [Pyrinomonadaceae bacterium]
MEAIQKKSKTQNFYDKIAEVHHLSHHINGYKRSVAKVLRNLNLEVTPESTILDAGMGTGVITQALYFAGLKPKQVIGVDLSHNSLRVAQHEFDRNNETPAEKISTVQGNVLSLPLADESVDLILTCGVLEYVPLKDGLSELARVLKPGGRVVLIPIKPSFVGAVLKLLYKFNIHTVENVINASRKYFEIDGKYKFPITDPIGWSKFVIVLKKKA